MQQKQLSWELNPIVAHISCFNPPQPVEFQFTDRIGGSGERLAIDAMGVMPGVGGIGAIWV
jgi:hypothetical protein